jgi:hypothetical protein
MKGSQADLIRFRVILNSPARSFVGPAIKPSSKKEMAFRHVIVRRALLPANANAWKC